MFDLNEYLSRMAETGAFLRRTVTPFPAVGVIAGTGLGDLGDEIRVRGTLSYAQIPHFPVSTVQGHHGQMIWGSLASRDVLVLQGRFHLYEGYAPHEIAFPIRVLAHCGLRGLIITNAAGGLNPQFTAGDIMTIADHINMTGANPLAGPHAPAWGDRFPDMSSVYDRDLRRLAAAAATAAGIPLREGVYIGVRGPCLETPSETRFFRACGADAIGMSTVQEVIAAVQARLRVLGLSVITNVNIPEHMEPTSLEAIIRVAEGSAPRLRRLIRGVVAAWPEA